MRPFTWQFASGICLSGAFAKGVVSHYMCYLARFMSQHTYHDFLDVSVLSLCRAQMVGAGAVTVHQQAVSQPPKVSSHVTSCPSQQSILINTLAIFHGDLIFNQKFDGFQGDSSFLTFLEEPIKSILSYEPRPHVSASQSPQPSVQAHAAQKVGLLRASLLTCIDAPASQSCVGLRIATWL